MPTTSTSAIRQSTTNSGLTRASNVVTVTLSTGTQLNPQVGDTVVVSGVTPTSFNGTHTITERVSSTQYKFSQAGSDESSSVHGTSGGDYTSLSAWEAAMQTTYSGDLVTNDVQITAECYDDWSSGLSDVLDIDGWTSTDSTRYIKVTVASGHRHDGTPKSGFFLAQSTSGTTLLFVREDYTQLEWLDAEQLSTSSGKYCIRFLTGTNSTAKNCIAKNNSSDQGAFTCNSAVTTKFIQCLAYSSYIGFNITSYTYTAWNCVAANNTDHGFYAIGGTCSAINCVSYLNGTDYRLVGFASGSNNTNATSSASTTNVPGANPVANIASGDFVNAASNNFHLASGSALIGAGTNLYSDFTTDIDGDTWPSAGAWDIGFDYYQAAGVSVTPGVSSLLLTGYAPTVTNSTPTNVTVNTDVGALTLTGYAPTVVVPVIVNPGVGSLAITGYAPDVAVTLSVATGVGSLTLAGLAPTLTVTENRFTQSGVGALSITGYAPTVGVSQSTATDVGALTITGYAPTVVETPASPVIPVGAAELLLNGYPPIVVNSGDRREQGAGKPSRQGKRRRVVIGDKVYEVAERDMPALLEAVLTDRKPPRTAEVVETVKQKRRKRRGDDAAPVELPAMPDGPTPEDIAQRVELVQAQLQAQAQADMLRMLDRVAERISIELQDEEDAVLALLLA